MWFSLPNMVASTPKCECARACLFIGLRSDHHGIVGSTGEAPAENIEQAHCCNVVFQGAGVTTGIAGKWENGYDGSFVPDGWDFAWLPWKPAFPNGNPNYVSYSAKNTDGSTTTYGATNDPSNYSTDVTFAKAVQFVADNADPDGPPIFLLVTPESPHRTYVPAARHTSDAVGTAPARSSDWQASIPTQPAWIQALAQLSAPEKATLEADRTDARRTLLALDDGIDALLDALDTAGVTDNTVVVFLTDNGQHWGRFNRFPSAAGDYLKQTNYPEVMGISCHVWWPATVTPGSRPNVVVILDDDRTNGEIDENTMLAWTARLASAGVTELGNVCTTVDLTATFYDLFGVTPPVVLDGVSLAGVLLGRPVPWKTSVETCWRASGAPVPAWWGLWTADAVYTEWDNGSRELYDLDADPDCSTSVHGDAGYAAIKAAMAATLDGLIAQTEGQALDAGRPLVLVDGEAVKVPLRMVYGGVAVEAAVVVGPG